MLVLLEILLIALVAVAVARLAAEPWRGRALNGLKFWVTIRAFWLLLSHPVTLEDGSQVAAGRLVLQTLEGLEPGPFIVFCLAAAGIKFLGILASMYRWKLLLSGQAIELPFRHIFGSFLIGRFIGTFLPSTAGLDGYKLYDAARFSGRTVEVTATTALEKVIGVFGIFLTFLVSLPFGIRIFGENATLVAAITVPIALGLIGALLLVLWFPGLVQWLVEHVPIPGKRRLEGLVRRISHSAAAYRDKKGLVLQALFLSWAVHFTTAVMYYFTALAIGAMDAQFWPVTFASSIQIFATVISPFTIAGEGIREAAQYWLLKNQIGAGPSIVSAALGFWAAEALTLAGAYFWWFRPKDYTPSWCRVEGVQVDYDEAARQAAALESDEERAEREARTPAQLLPFAQRARLSASVGLGAGLFAGLVIGVAEAAVIALGGLGGDAQVFWFGPITHALFLGGLGLAGGAVLGALPMEEDEIRGWTPSLALMATLLPLGLFIAFFRLRRDVYLEQLPPAPVLVALLGAAAVLALLLFFAGPRLFRGRIGNALRPPSVLIALLGVAIAGGASSAWVVGSGGNPEPRDGIPPALADRPNVVLVMVDTLRSDHLSCYGGPVPTPNLCSLAEDGGTRFRGFSHSSWTKPATATLLTSLLPSSHGVMSKPSSLSPDVELIPEVLRGSGYATGGIVSNINLASSFGFDQGYDEYHYLGPDYLFGARESSSKLILYQLLRVVYFKLKPGLRVGDFYQSGETVNEVAFDFLDRHANSRFFLFLHYMDPHDPYFAHPYDGTGIARAGNQHPDPALAEEMHRLYLGEIAYLDERFGEFLAKLRTLGLEDDTLIALVSDHGEEFYEHGGWWHGTTLYDEQIAVPFLVKWSRHAGLANGEGDGEIARMLDVAPTLIARTGARPPDGMQGIDLVERLSRRGERERLIYAEEDHEGNVLRAVRSEDWKWIEANEGNQRGLPVEELFHVGKDPDESENLAESTAWVVQELRDHADAQERLAESRAVEGGGEADLSEQEIETLRALGYLEE
jgi:arylsulfatase A-like enzyme